ncbi:hypothetical protein AFLA_002317 [Aspergillus flavus NRRL3357]|nr:hypothetical protein AFLA_002317 [Aspergillus flavus NRRL3357]
MEAVIAVHVIGGQLRRVVPRDHSEVGHKGRCLSIPCHPTASNLCRYDLILCKYCLHYLTRDPSTFPTSSPDRPLLPFFSVGSHIEYDKGAWTSASFPPVPSNALVSPPASRASDLRPRDLAVAQAFIRDQLYRCYWKPIGDA